MLFSGSWPSPWLLSGRWGGCLPRFSSFGASKQQSQKQEVRLYFLWECFSFGNPSSSLLSRKPEAAERTFSELESLGHHLVASRSQTRQPHPAPLKAHKNHTTAEGRRENPESSKYTSPPSRMWEGVLQVPRGQGANGRLPLKSSWSAKHSSLGFDGPGFEPLCAQPYLECLICVLSEWQAAKGDRWGRG